MRTNELEILYSEDGAGDVASCPLAALLCFLRVVVNRDMPVGQVVSSGDCFRPRPAAREVEAFRIWPQGLEAVLAIDRTFGFLDQHQSTAVARAAFMPIEPVLRAWHADLAFSPSEAVARTWLDCIGWQQILSAASRRDKAAYRVLAGVARLVEGDVVALTSAG